jgi:7-cyano-7-deazaguanine reductase
MNEFEFTSDPTQAKLEAFDNPSPNNKYEIQFTCPEWTALCPRSGFPDFGDIHIHYIPKGSCIELKSLKLYINSYRDRRIFHEEAVNQILNDLVAVCKPWYMEIKGDFNVRGNIKTIIRSKYQDKDFIKESIN